MLSLASFPITIVAENYWLDPHCAADGKVVDAILEIIWAAGRIANDIDAGTDAAMDQSLEWFFNFGVGSAYATYVSCKSMTIA